MLTCMVRVLEELMRNETEKENFEKYCLGCACNTPLGSAERFKFIFNYFCILDWCFYQMLTPC